MYSKQQNMINKDRILTIQEKIKNAISKIEKEENVVINFGSIRYTANDYATTMSVTSNVKDVTYDKLQEVTSKRYGFTQNIIGMDFNHTTLGKMKVVEFKTKNRKYPIIAETLDGKRYKFDKASIKFYLGGDKMINRNGNLDKLLG